MLSYSAVLLNFCLHTDAENHNTMASRSFISKMELFNHAFFQHGLCTSKVLPMVAHRGLVTLGYVSCWSMFKLAKTQKPCLCESLILKRMKTKKAKSKQKAAASSVKIDASIAEGIIDLESMKKEMVSCFEKMKTEFNQKYATKLSAGILDKLPITVAGDKSMLYEVASVKSSAKEFTITPMVEGENVLKQILQSIQKSGLNLNPRVDGTIIKVPISIASSDYKENLLKSVKSSAEKSKVLIRKIRQQRLVDLRKEKDVISQDNARLIEKQIQQLTDFYVDEINKLLNNKETELKS